MGASDGSASALRVELDKSREINGQCAEAGDDSAYTLWKTQNLSSSVEIHDTSKDTSRIHMSCN